LKYFIFTNAEEFNYDPSSPNGPPNWGNTWPLCRDGRTQSPIDLRISRANVTYSSGIQRNYQPANATLLTSGHDVMVVKYYDILYYINEYKFYKIKLN